MTPLEKDLGKAMRVKDVADYLGVLSTNRIVRFYSK
jgi:hypothetical protein